MCRARREAPATGGVRVDWPAVLGHNDLAPLGRDAVQQPAGEGEALSLGLLRRRITADWGGRRGDAVPLAAADGPSNGPGAAAVRVLGGDTGP
eukprot:1068897-Alexandrium_andersonii.AAC.1